MEIRTTLSNTPVKNNVYDYNPGLAAGGILIDADNDAASEPWETLTLTNSSVTGNTPPQCASGGGTLPPGCPGT